MKKNILIKYSILIITLVVPIVILALCDDSGQTCTNASVGANSSSYEETGHGGNWGGSTVFHTTSNEIKGMDIFRNSDGNVLKIRINEEDDRKRLIALGYSEDMIFSGNELGGVTLPTGSLSDENKATEWQSYYKSLADNFSTTDENGVVKINPNSEGYRLGVALGLYTGNVDYDSKNLLDGNTTGFSVIKGGTATINGKETFVTTENAETTCSAYINNTSNSAAGAMGSYCRAIRDSFGDFYDEGYYECMSCEERVHYQNPTYTETQIAAECCVEKYGDSSKGVGGECCTYYNSYSECNPNNGGGPGGGDDDDDDDVPQCTSTTVKPIVKVAKPQKTGQSSPATCGGTFLNQSYRYETDEECKLVYETQTTTTINLAKPNNRIYYAGSAFNWSPITSTQTTVTRLYDTTLLENEIERLSVIIKNTESLIATADCNISALEAANKNITMQDVNAECGQIADETKKSECEKNIKAANGDKSKTLEENGKKIAEYKANKEKYKNDATYLAAKDEIEKYKTCQDNADYSRATTSTSSNVASSSNETMTLKNAKGEIIYSAKKGEIVALEKNSGLPLKRADLTGDILEFEKYLTIASDFYIPTSVPNGSQGILSRTVSFGQQSISYSCPLGTANNILCPNGDCPELLGLSNIIYRPISLSTPFPYTSGGNYDYRAFGANWSKELVETYIKNNRNVSEYNVYNLKPLYTIVLTPSTIKDIREYNKTHDYNDFAMSCDNGYKCLSKFIWENFDGIVDESNSCASSNGWDTACYNGGVSS